MWLWQREEDEGVRLEATMTAREDGSSLRSHDGEEEWAMVTQLKAGRQQQQRRRQRLWPMMAAVAGKRLGNAGSDSCSDGGVVVQEWAAITDLRWSQGRGSSDDKQGSSNGDDGLHGSQGKMGWEVEGKSWRSRDGCDGGREERNRGGRRRKRWPREEKTKEGLATVEATGKRTRQRGPARVAAAGEQWGPVRKRGRKVRRV
ncbi:hypothetical protein BHM03_00040498 [Ensete ventricosum]|nr:hypothetical protein BHM03_00040498 [Ensete ventricosum]